MPTRVLCWLLILAGLLATSCRKADDSAPTTAAPEIVTTPGGIEMVAIPPGRFLMGSADGKEDESPVREVAISAFLMDRTEMTQANYAKHVPINGSHFKGPDRPVEMISWSAAALFCNLRSRAEGLVACYNEETGECDFAANGYRLPTEAEWEYACRAGATDDPHFDRDPRLLSQWAWWADNSDKQTKPVGKKKPNAWGLYDMIGNVAEWCNDVYQADYYRSGPASDPHGPGDGERRVLRGGAWNSKADGCRWSGRVGETPGFQDACFARDALGFRCVRRISQPK